MIEGPISIYCTRCTDARSVSVYGGVEAMNSVFPVPAENGAEIGM